MGASSNTHHGMKSSSPSIGDPISVSEFRFCELVASGNFFPHEAASLAFHMSDTDAANGRVPLLLGDPRIRGEIERLRGRSHDDKLRCECERLLGDETLKPYERLKVIQTLDKVNERAGSDVDPAELTEELRAWIAERLQNAPGPFSDV